MNYPNNCSDTSLSLINLEHVNIGSLLRKRCLGIEQALVQDENFWLGFFSLFVFWVFGFIASHNPSHRQSLISFCPYSFAFFEILDKWINIVCRFGGLASFTFNMYLTFTHVVSENVMQISVFHLLCCWIVSHCVYTLHYVYHSPVEGHFHHF